MSNKASDDSNKASDDSNKASDDSNKASDDSNKASDDSNRASDDPLALATLIAMGAVASELLHMVGNEWTGSSMNVLRNQAGEVLGGGTSSFTAPSAAPMATVPKTESAPTVSKPIVPLSAAAKPIEPSTDGSGEADRTPTTERRP